MKSPYFAWTRTRLYIFSSIFLILLLATIQGCQEKQILSIEEHLERGQFYLEQQNFEASIIDLKIVLQGEPDHAEARLLLAKAQLALGDASSAETQ